MRIDVALETIGELTVEARIMRRLVTAGTIQHATMFTTVAFNTGHIVMSFFAFRQGRNLAIMTGLAEAVRQGTSKSNLRWCMWRTVANQTIRIALTINMRLVTRCTLLGLSMLWVTAVATLLSMSTGGHCKTRRGLFVTCQACRVSIFRLR